MTKSAFAFIVLLCAHITSLVCMENYDNMDHLTTVTPGLTQCEKGVIQNIKNKKYTTVFNTINSTSLSTNALEEALGLIEDAKNQNTKQINNYTHQWQAFSGPHSFALFLLCHTSEQEIQEKQKIITLIKTKLKQP